MLAGGAGDGGKIMNDGEKGGWLEKGRYSGKLEWNGEYIMVFQL